MSSTLPRQDFTDTATFLLLAALEDKIRKGDISYKELIYGSLADRTLAVSLGATDESSAKNAALMAMNLSCRAAKESGLSEKAIAAVKAEYLPRLEQLDNGYDIALLCDSFMYRLVRLIKAANGGGIYSAPIQTCCTYVNEHICDRLTIHDLAKRTGYSPDHLTRKFQKEFGEPLKDYILKTKIQRAQLLLTTTAVPLNDIAAMLSFSSASHFSQVFRRYAGETPSAYRARYYHQ